MQLVTVGPKYQIVIPKEVRKKIKGIKPGSQVFVRSVDDSTITVKTAPQDWVKESYGFMKDAWKDINPIAEIERMRDEWEEKLSEQSKIWEKSENPNSSK